MHAHVFSTRTCCSSHACYDDRKTCLRQGPLARSSDRGCDHAIAFTQNYGFGVRSLIARSHQ
jgi:hypothetical protein